LPGARSFDPARYPKQIARLCKAFSDLREHHINQGGGEVELPLDAEATAAWPQLYCELDPNTDAEGVLVHLAARRVQQIRRMAAIYALADACFEVGLEHINAATAVMDYSIDSMDYVYSRPWWGDPANAHDPAGMAPKLVEALQRGPMPRSEISIRVFQRNYTAKELNALRDTLINRAQIVVDKTGRTEVWRLP
jgi:hypothetical protein